MALAKPERMSKRTYPDEALLDALKDVRLHAANIPEHEFLQFRRLQSLIYELRLAAYDFEAMQTEAFVGAVLFPYVNCKVAATRREYDFEASDRLVQEIGARLPANLNVDRVPRES